MNLNLGENIKRYRKNKKLTQKQLADKLQVSSITIQNYENNRREPSIAMLNKLAAILDCTVADLLEEKILTLKPEIKDFFSGPGKVKNEESIFQEALYDYIGFCYGPGGDLTEDEILSLSKEITKYVNLLTKKIKNEKELKEVTDKINSLKNT